MQLSYSGNNPWVGLLIFSVVVALFLFVWWQMYGKHPFQKDQGTVVAKRKGSFTAVSGQKMTQFFVTLQLQSGEEIELQIMSASMYKSLEIGAAGTVTYRGQVFVSLDESVSVRSA